MASNRLLAIRPDAANLTMPLLSIMIKLLSLSLIRYAANMPPVQSP